MDFSRPTNSGMTMWGYTTTSRNGRTGIAPGVPGCSTSGVSVLTRGTFDGAPKALVISVTVASVVRVSCGDEPQRSRASITFCGEQTTTAVDWKIPEAIAPC